MAKAKKPKDEAPTTAQGALDAILKRYGSGAVVDMGAAPAKWPAISTGSIGLDRATGIGGLPRGRLVEIYVPKSAGKTTLCLQAVAATQALGLKAAFIDAEHALDPTYAAALGVNVEDLLISQPDYGEQGLEIAAMLASSGAFGLVVVDSVAALVPKAELEGEMGDSHVGLQARMMSQGCRKLAGVAAKSSTLVVFINQLRTKIGVTWGCFHYDARVVLSDGSTERIGKIVNSRQSARVRTFDPVTGEVGESVVTDWHTNGKTDHWLRFTAQKAGGNGRSQFKVTPNHMLFTPGMVERPAGEVQPGEKILVQGEFAFNEGQMCLALGQVLGDGSVRRHGLTYQLRVGHGDDQADYAQWKASVFGELVGWSNGSTHFQLSPTCDLMDVEDGPHLIELGGARTVAAWAMDDGSFSGSFARWGWGKFEISCKRWTTEQREEAADALERLHGVRPTVTRTGLLWSGDRTRAFMEWIAPFVPPCMAYKIHPTFRRRCGTYQWSSEPNKRVGLVPSEVLDVCEVPAGKKTVKFDITVADTHTYMVDSAAVHNSPETTTGGKALEFYASMRLDVRFIGKVKQGDDVVAAKTRVKVVKNKLAPPFKECEFEIGFGRGVLREAELLDAALLAGLVVQSGSWFSFAEDERLGDLAGQKIAQGRNRVLDAIAGEQATKLAEIVLEAP